MYKPCCTLKAVAVSCTCLTGSLRCCQKQNTRACMPPSDWPVKPFIRKPLHQRTSPAACHGPTSWMLNGLQTLFLHSWLFSRTHIWCDWIYWFRGIMPFRGWLYGVVEEVSIGSSQTWVLSWFCHFLAVCPLGKLLNLFGGPIFGSSNGRIQEGWNKWSPVTPLSSKRQWQPASVTLWKPGEHMELFN